MEPVTAIGLAGNIVQFIDFAAKVMVRLHSFQSSRGEIPKVFQGISVRLPLLIADLDGCQARIKNLPPKTETALSAVVERCKGRVEELNKILDETLPEKGDSAWRKSRKALKSLRKETEVKSIEEELGKLMQTLTHHHVLRMGVNGNQTIAQAVVEEEKKGPFFMVPKRKVVRFVGRQTVIRDITVKLEGSQIVVLQAMGGQGKTQIALEFCRHADEKGLYAGIFWVDAASEVQLRRSLETIADTIKPSSRVFENGERKIAYVKQELGTRIHPYLLVLDNYDDPVEFPNVLDFLPSGKRGHVLMTTRQVDVGRHGTLIVLPGLSEDESLDLFFYRSGYERSTTNDEHAKQIAGRLGFHPLALDQAAAFINKRKGRLKLDEFIEYYESRKKEILNSTPKVWEYRRRNADDQEVSLNVFTTWEMSLGLLKGSESGEEYALLLSLLAYFHNGDIPGSLFRAFVKTARGEPRYPPWMDKFTENNVWSQERFVDALVELHDLALIEGHFTDSEGDIHASLHPLIKDWILMRGTDEERRRQSILQVDILGDLCEVEDQALSETVGHIFPHVLVMEEHYREFVVPYLSLESSVINELVSHIGANLCQISRFLHSLGKYTNSERLMDIAISSQTPILGDTHPVILKMKTRRGNALMELGQHHAAESVFLALYRVYRAEGDGSESARVWILIHHSEVLYRLGRYKEAEKEFGSIASWMAICPAYKKQYMWSKTLWAQTLLKLDKFVEAEQKYRDLLAMSTAEFGPEHPKTIMNISNLAGVQMAMGKTKESIKQHTEIYSVATRIQGLNHPDTLKKGADLGSCLTELGFFEEAEEFLREILTREEKVYGSEHPMALKTLNKLAWCLLGQGKKDEGMKVAGQVLSLQEKILDPWNPDLLESQRTLSRALQANGYFQEGEILLRRVRKKIERTCWQTHSMNLQVCHDLGCNLRDQNRKEEARELLDWVRVHREQVLGRNHFQTLTTAVEYALLLDPATQEDLITLILINAARGLSESLGELHPIHKRIAEAAEALHIDLTAQEDMMAKILREAAQQLSEFHDEWHPIHKQTAEASEASETDSTAKTRDEFISSLQNDHPDMLPTNTFEQADGPPDPQSLLFFDLPNSACGN